MLPEKPIIYCISEGRARRDNLQEIKEDISAKITNAANFGVRLFQIREKELSAAALFELTREAVAAASASGLRVLVNGRADVALAAGAAGVHLPANGLLVGELRANTPPEFMIGVSTHSAGEVSAAASEGADFAVFGPVFASQPKGDGVGIGPLRAAVGAAGSMPVLALGGMNAARAQEVLAAGASGWAAISYLNELLRWKT